MTMDKPAEGLFAWVKGDGSHPCALMIGECGLFDALPVAVACSMANQLNAAHDSIVKPLREKADQAQKLYDLGQEYKDKLEEAERCYKDANDAFDRMAVAHSDMAEDRDVWKERYEKLAKNVTYYLDAHDKRCEVNAFGCKLGSPSGVCAICDIRFSLAAHLALKGKT